jgi:tellurite resistance protein TerC
MSSQVLWWIAFAVIVVVLLVLDMRVFHRRSHVITIKESLLWTVSFAWRFTYGVAMVRRLSTSPAT